VRPCARAAAPTNRLVLPGRHRRIGPRGVGAGRRQDGVRRPGGVAGRPKNRPPRGETWLARPGPQRRRGLWLVSVPLSSNTAPGAAFAQAHGSRPRPMPPRQARAAAGVQPEARSPVGPNRAIKQSARRSASSHRLRPAATGSSPAAPHHRREPASGRAVEVRLGQLRPPSLDAAAAPRPVCPGQSVPPRSLATGWRVACGRNCPNRVRGTGCRGTGCRGTGCHGVLPGGRARRGPVRRGRRWRQGRIRRRRQWAVGWATASGGWGPGGLRVTRRHRGS
jgi:hypothetical protein